MRNTSQNKISVQNARQEAGFTLVELMAVLVIMTLAGMIVATGMPAAVKAYQEAVDVANAQTLLTTTTTRLHDLVCVANPDEDIIPVKNDGVFESITFASRETGYSITIKNTNDGIYLDQKAMDPLGNVISSAEPEPLVPSKASEAKKQNSKLIAHIGNADFNENEGTITFTKIKVQRTTAAGSGEGDASEVQEFSNAECENLVIDIIGS